MLKNLIAILLVASVSLFAQDYSAPPPTSETQYEDVSAYTSGAPAPETPVMNINEVASTDPIFYVSIHPISMFLWWALLGIPTISLTIEGCVGPSFAVITRPTFMYWGDTRTSDNVKEEVSLYDYGITLGIRYYFAAHHQGWYIEPQFIYERVTLDYTYDYDDDIDRYYPRTRDEDMTASGNLFGGGAVMGYKFMSGRFTMSSDIGYAYTTISLKGRSREDVEEASAVGAGFIGNVTAGFAF
jgi:hypothetical protein